MLTTHTSTKDVFIILSKIGYDQNFRMKTLKL